MACRKFAARPPQARLNLKQFFMEYFYVTQFIFHSDVSCPDDHRNFPARHLCFGAGRGCGAG
jgi:hypothetical protein